MALRRSLAIGLIAALLAACGTATQPPQTLAAAITEAGYEVTGTR